MKTPGDTLPTLGHDGASGSANLATSGDVITSAISSDPVETALADALQRAAAAGAWDAVAAVTAELRARREVRAGVVDLSAEKAKRWRQ